MEEIIGLLVVLAVGIFKAVNKKFEDAGKQPGSPSKPFVPFGPTDILDEGNEVFMPKSEPVAPKPVAPKPVSPKPVVPKPRPSTIEVVDRQVVGRKPMLIEEEEEEPKEKIDPKKLVLYSEIMTPKFNE